MEQGQADWVFAAGAMSPRNARRLIAQRLLHMPDESLPVIVLLTSELVTNAVSHGTGQVGVHVTWGDVGIRVEVEDQSPEWPVMRARKPGALTGLGLQAVDGLSSAWGVMDKGNSKIVWFTIDN